MNEETNWNKVQQFLQAVGIEIDYLVWRVACEQKGQISANDTPGERLFMFGYEDEKERGVRFTEETVKARLSEIAELAKTWGSNETFPQF